MQFILLVSALQCYTNIEKDSNTTNTTTEPSLHIQSINCTAIAEETKINLTKWGFSLPDILRLNWFLGCFTKYDFCRVLYSEERQVAGCSCEKELGPRMFKMDNNTCKDLSENDAHMYNFHRRDKINAINRRLNGRVPKNYEPHTMSVLLGRGPIRFTRLCTCTGNLCNDPSKLQQSDQPKITRGIPGIGTTATDHMTEKKKGTKTKLFTTAIVRHPTSSEMSNSIHSKTKSSSAERKNNVLRSNISGLAIFSMISTVIAMVG